jgi:thioredoxin-like negative regulator of GroEL
MEPSGFNRFFRTGFSLSIAAATILLQPTASRAQTPMPSSGQAPVLPSGPNQAQPLPASGSQAQPIDPNNPNVLRPTGQDSGVLSMQGGQRLLAEAEQAFSAQDYPLATKKLQEARQVFNQLSNFHQDLAGSFSGIDNRIADSQRRKALDSAQMRDEATYRLALSHRAQNQPELAVPLLVQIVRSQQPTRDLGKKAYQQLFELGFVESAFPQQSGAAPR